MVNTALACVIIGVIWYKLNFVRLTCLMQTQRAISIKTGKKNIAICFSDRIVFNGKWRNAYVWASKQESKQACKQASIQACMKASD